MTTNATARDIADVRVTIGSGRSVHRGNASQFERGGRTVEHLRVSCGAAARAGGSQLRRTRDDAEVTCRKCLA